MSASDADLICRIAAGDRDAFGEFYDRHSARILGLLLRMIRSRSEADDVLQDCFLQVWSQAARYSAERASPIGWLVLLARSRALDHLRRKRRDRLTAESETEVGTECDDALTQSEEAALARRALSQLPDEQRGVIQLAFYSGLTHEEIAASQRIPLGTVKTRIRRGMMRIREILSVQQKAVAS